MKKILLALIFINGCATQGINRDDQNQLIKEFYASVESVKPVELSSNVKTGIVAGSFVGITDELDGNHEDMIAGGIAGALVGGLFTAIFEGGNEAFEYSLNSQREGQFTFVQKEALQNDTSCVKVRVSKKTTISAVSENFCEFL